MEKNKDYINPENGDERRYIQSPVEMREGEKEGSKIVGRASLVGQRYDMGWYEEEVMPGAFDEVLKDDVRALFNHDPNFILARSKNGEGTLRLFIDDAGNLAYEYKTPNRQYAKDLEDAIKSGDVNQSSFGFRIAEQAWIEREGEKDLRQITKIEQLFDVSPVTYPASPDTTVAKRSYDQMKEENKEDLGDSPITNKTLREAQMTLDRRELINY